MASSVDRRIEGDLSEDMGQRDPASLIRPRSTEPIRAWGLPPRQQAGHMTASDLRFQYAKFSLRAGGHPHMSSGRPKAGLVGRRTARLRGGRAQARRHRLRAHAAAGRARQGSYKARVVRTATPSCRRSCSSCCASPLPQVPGRGGEGLARRPPGRPAAGRLFPFLVFTLPAQIAAIADQNKLY